MDRLAGFLVFSNTARAKAISESLVLAAGREIVLGPNK
jgi:hypothetical protein